MTVNEKSLDHFLTRGGEIKAVDILIYSKLGCVHAIHFYDMLAGIVRICIIKPG